MISGDKVIILGDLVNFVKSCKRDIFGDIVMILGDLMILGSIVMILAT